MGGIGVAQKGGKQGMNNRDFVKIISWNVAGLKKKTVDKDFISFLREGDIVGLVETWGGYEEEFCITGFHTFQKWRKKSKKMGRNPGGIAVLVREKKGWGVEKVENSLEEVLWIKLQGKGFTLVVGTVYCHPVGSKLENKKFWKQLEKELEYMESKFPYATVMLMGDFNARVGREIEKGEQDSVEDLLDTLGDEGMGAWCSVERASKDGVVTPNGKKLLKMCREQDMFILNGRTEGDKEGEWTCINQRGASVADYIIVTQELIGREMEFRVQARVESDHAALVLWLRMYEETESTKERVGRIGTSEQGRVLRKFIWKETKVDRVITRCEDETAEFLSIEIEKATSEKLIDKADELLRTLLQRVAEDMEVKEETRTSKNREKDRGWFDEECSIAKQEARKKLRELRKNRCDELYRVYVEAKEAFRSICDVKKEAWEEEKISRIRKLSEVGDSKNFWKEIRKLNGYKGANTEIEEEQWVEHFREVFEIGDSGDITEIDMENMEERADESLDKEIGMEEISKAIHSMRNGKAPGEDGLPVEIFKVITEKPVILKALSKLFNTIFEQGRVPRRWGTGIICPLYKGKGDKNTVDNYRGITLLNVIEKIFTRVLAERIKKWAEREGKLSPAQAGFREGFSTVDNILIVNAVRDKYVRDKKGKVFCGFLDFEKAFDRVDRNKLWLKLKGLGVSRKMLRMLQGVYEKTGLSIRTNQFRAVGRIISDAGVRQGCQLSPILFALFINDLIAYVEEGDFSGPCLRGREIKALLSADDAVLLSLTPAGLQKSLEIVEGYCEQWGLRLNVTKTKIVVFRKGRRRWQGFRWLYKGQEVEVVEKFKYLGVIFQSGNTWECHVEEALSKAKKAMIIVRKALYRFRNLPLALVKNIFNIMVKPILLYGVEVWGTYGDLKKFDKFALHFYKQLLGVGKSAANVGTLLELDQVPLSKEIEGRLVGYALGLKFYGGKRELQRLCLEDASVRKEEGWMGRAERLLIKMGWEDRMEEVIGSKRGLKVWIKNQIKTTTSKELEEGVKGMASLKWLREVRQEETGEAFYLKLKNRNRRSAIAWFRLGGWRWQGKKEDVGGRKCPLCGERDGEIHILIECEELRGLREGMGEHEGMLTPWNVKHYFRTRDEKVLDMLGGFLAGARIKRGEVFQSQIKRGTQIV